MIRINFLPYRKARDISLRNSFYAKLLGSLALGCVAGAMATLVIADKLLDQNNVNELLRAEIATLDIKVGKVDSISQELAVLENRKKTIIGLYADRNVAVKLMSYFTTMAPNGVVFSDVNSSDKDGKLVIGGYSETTEDVGSFIAALSARADFFQKVELIDIKADKLASKSVFKFSIGMKINQKLM